MYQIFNGFDGNQASFGHGIHMRYLTYLAPIALLGIATFANAATLIENEKLTATDGARDDDFGYSVAISGTTAIVGARGDGDVGSAYLFDMTNPVPRPPTPVVPLPASVWLLGAALSLMGGMRSRTRTRVV